MPARGLVGLLLGGSLATYAFGSMNNALPVIGAELGAGRSALSLLLGAYACGFASVLIIAGRLGDRFGRRRVYLAGVTAFAATSVLAGGMTGVAGLLIFRVLQGIAAGVFMPQVLSTIQATTDGRFRVRAVSAYAAVLGFSTGVGQVISGGLIGVDLAGLSWRPVLWLGAALALIALAGSRSVPETRSARPAAADGFGAVMLAVLIAAPVFALSIGPALGWPWWSVGLIISGLVLARIFFGWERRLERTGRMPLAPPTILRLPALRTGLIMAAVFFVGYGGLMNIYALMSQAPFSQQGLDMTAMTSALTLAPFVLSYVIGSFLVGPITRRLHQSTMPVGAVLQAVALATMTGLALMVGPVEEGGVGGIAVLLQIPFVFTGLAQAIMYGPLVQNVLSQVPNHAAGLSGGLFSTVQQAALGLGVAIIGGVYAPVAADGGALTGYGAGIAADAIAALIFLGLALLLRRQLRPAV